ncbi:hypothetical protein ASPACDRAFT_53638 [Aspergillus aculeatus ATCC 16872]|uniref:Rieske domain-containing protein n=1 Tax=Aspergillus aculeatus (strain ATCC 16872 / CBS 172.66 / WB 5094) TaxID=690307 RepID=A0A1L9WMM4_ASPA1|nr:uncharacterized protein ASPACDRAFT_53638 [Aspergillus aculeatus ATCC 16872]OJJ97404.1 hypothetical protein ASPACDRAFT_53638 [Aspergillus aculeatus ATCC 16872]
MATPMMHYFGFGSNAPPYTKEIYELERRAIFTKRWIFLTHSSRLKEASDWLRYEIAGFDFIVTRDRQSNFNAFHNICRHRAYPVIEKEGSRNSKILSYRYHGWSYGLNGKLAKATGFKDIESVDKEQNSLFRIHLKVDKILANNFNECYHYPTTHSDIPEFLNLDSFDSDLKDGHIQHHCISTPEQIGKDHISLYEFKPIGEIYARVMGEDKVLYNNQQLNLDRNVFINSQLHPKFEKAPIFFQSTVRQVIIEHFTREKAGGRDI